MSIKERKYFYNAEYVDNNLELDFLNKDYIMMDIETATTFRIPRAFKYRPDLISLKFYNNYHLGWLIAHHNEFLDPIIDFEVGKLIKIPDLDSYFRYYKTYTR